MMRSGAIPSSISPSTRDRTTTKWRDFPLYRPEAALVGVQYNGVWPVESDMVVSDPSSPVFEGTGLDLGDQLAGLPRL